MDFSYFHEDYMAFRGC